MYGNGTKVEENGLVDKGDKVLIFKEIEMKVLIVRVMEDWIETILSGDGNLKIVTFQGSMQQKWESMLIRGKRLVFVGDSINRNQWESMLCMLLSALKDPKRVYEARGRKITKKKGNYSFRFLDYQCTVEYYVSHFLVHESKARVGQKRRPTLRIDAIDHGSSRWRGADILVFNTTHWWSHYKTKAGGIVSVR
ncbi:Protein trichome birefringence-like 6 [Trifolium repens]|nr:Protein trichome birefringence-like 6 [Trifolium repens]